MKIFTFLADKIDLSIFKETITVYNNIAPKSPFDFNELDTFIDKPEMHQLKVVRNHDKNHYKYHQDDLNDAKYHLHIQFAETISVTGLTLMAKNLVDHQLLSHIESEQLLKTYTAASKKTMPAILSGTVKKLLTPEKNIRKELSNKSFSHMLAEDHQVLSDVSNRNLMGFKKLFFSQIAQKNTTNDHKVANNLFPAI